eukprot:gene33559-44939_t
MEKNNLEKLERFLKREKWTGYGIPEVEIKELENSIQQKFPDTYRKFLLLTGGLFGPMPISNGFYYLQEYDINNLAKKNLKEYGISLKNDNFWVFAENEGAEVIFFFYFDEGDDPPSFMDKKRWKRETKGLDEAEITKVESQIEKKFPQAYREFLWLTGKQGFRAWSESHEIDYLIEKKVAEIVPKLLKEYGVDLPKDNYWVMAIENGSIDFFYFDEGENPPIYVCEYE